MDLNNHVVKSSDGSPFHSNGFAVVASGGNIGSTTCVSFDQRQQIDGNRQVIGNYQQSVIGNTHNIMRANPVRSGVNRGVTYQSPTLRQNPNNSPRQFREPVPRPYNPFS